MTCRDNQLPVDLSQHQVAALWTHPDCQFAYDYFVGLFDDACHGDCWHLEPQNCHLLSQFPDLDEFHESDIHFSLCQNALRGLFLMFDDISWFFPGRTAHFLSPMLLLSLEHRFQHEDILIGLVVVHNNSSVDQIDDGWHESLVPNHHMECDILWEEQIPHCMVVDMVEVDDDIREIDLSSD